jgi:hypothetical protein
LSDPDSDGLDASLLWDKDTLKSLFNRESSALGSKRGRLLDAYLKAYFGSPSGLLVRLETSNPNGWTRALASALKLDADSPTVRTLADHLKTQMADNPNLASLKFLHLPIPREEPGFVSRDGTRYTFPGLAWNGTSVSVDQSQVGADLIRIVIEALRDEAAPLPFVANATRLKQPMDGPIEIYYPASPGWSVSADDFLQIQGTANHIEAVIGGTVGKAIRGGSAGALNNEAIAKVVETAAAVFARQVAERVGWCARKARVELPASVASSP